MTAVGVEGAHPARRSITLISARRVQSHRLGQAIYMSMVYDERTDTVWSSEKFAFLRRENTHLQDVAEPMFRFNVGLLDLAHHLLIGAVLTCLGFIRSDHRRPSAGNGGPACIVLSLVFWVSSYYLCLSFSLSLCRSVALSLCRSVALSRAQSSPLFWIKKDNGTEERLCARNSFRDEKERERERHEREI